MTGEDLKRMQDNFLATSKTLLREHGCLRQVSFIITLHKHIEKLFESGWGVEFIDPKTACVHRDGDAAAALILDLAMDWKKLYHACLRVFPETVDVLPPMLVLGQQLKVDDPYKRVMRPFLAHTRLEEKDVTAATMRHICGKVDAFACIMHSEGWLRVVEQGESAEDLAGTLSQDQKSIEVLFSSMETYDFTRMITVPILRVTTPGISVPRDGGKVVGFGDAAESVEEADRAALVEGRFVNLLKPLGVAS